MTLGAGPAPAAGAAGVAVPSAGPRARAIRVALIISQPIVILVVTWLALHGWSRTFRAPLVYSGDALFYLAQSKTTIEQGWWWWNPSLAAPLGYHALAFPQNSNVDQALVWIASLFTHDVALVVNVTWLAMLMISGATAAWCLSRLGVSRLGAWGSGILFALSPYAFYRNLTHFNLATYLIPFAATASVLLSADPNRVRWRWAGSGALFAGTVLLGFNNTYYAFFAAYLVACGALIGAIRARDGRPLLAGATCLAALMLATLLNLLPSVLVWHQHGRPEGLTHRVGDAELYGLKLRQLISPLPDHWFPPFRVWNDKEEAAGFPAETENGISRLGLIGSIGLVGLLIRLLARRGSNRLHQTERTGDLAGMTMAAVLLGTIGGIGSLFSLLVAPDIRAYNRITPFIAFFALAAVALWIDRATPRRRTRSIVWAAVLTVGLLDEVVAATFFNRLASPVAAEVRRLNVFVSGLEQRLPRGARVFQLPVRPYPLDGGVAAMGTYEHFKPYLASHTLRWSYPALTPAQVRWEHRVSALPPGEFVRALARDGFSAILVDRRGYDDHGDGAVQALRSGTSAPGIIAQNSDYVALDVRGEGVPGGAR
ncbi:MAG: hypothetical protein ABI051_02200 [Vicinamibacterales bacterium]